MLLNVLMPVELLSTAVSNWKPTDEDASVKKLEYKNYWRKQLESNVTIVLNSIILALTHSFLFNTIAWLYLEALKCINHIHLYRWMTVFI